MLEMDIVEKKDDERFLSGDDDDDDNENNDRPTFDDIFRVVGDRGAFTVLFFIGFSLMDCIAGSTITFFIFSGADPGWYCHQGVSNSSANTTSEQLIKGTCFEGKPTCENISFSDEYTSIVTEWSLICNRAYISKTVTSIFFAGVLVGALVSGQTSDFFGRKPTVLGNWALAVIGQTATSYAPNWGAYTALRFFTGIAGGGIAAVTTVLLSEYLSPKSRSLVGYRLGWAIGPLLGTIAGYFLRDWRKMSLAVGLWSVPFYIPAIFILPESARWLVQKRRFAEAEMWIKRMARINRKDIKLLDLKLLKQIADYEDEKRNHRQKYTYMDLFASKQMAAWSISVMFGWFTVSVFSYGISSQMSSLTGSLYLNMTISSVLTGLTRWNTAFVVNYIGRRKSYPLYMGLAGIFMITVLILDLVHVTEDRLPQTILVLIAMTVGIGGWAVVLLFSTELYPTLMRNVSTGAGNMAARVGGILAPQIAFLATYHMAIPFAVYGALATISSVVLYVVLPETKDRPLPEDVSPRRVRTKSIANGTITEMETIFETKDRCPSVSSERD